MELCTTLGTELRQIVTRPLRIVVTEWTTCEQVDTVMVATTCIATKHGSFSRTRQVAPM